MSFQSKVDEVQRNINSIKNQMRNRSDQVKNGNPTHIIDTNIKGGFSELNYSLEELESLIANSQLKQKQKDKQQKQYVELIKIKDHLKSVYDSYFEQKNQTLQLQQNEGDQQTNFQKKYNTDGLNSKQLKQLKKQQDQKQNEIVDTLLGALQGMKTLGNQTGQELDDHKKKLDKLTNNVDENTQRITKTQGKMVRLIEESSNTMLSILIIVQIASLILIWTMWH